MVQGLLILYILTTVANENTIVAPRTTVSFQTYWNFFFISITIFRHKPKIIYKLDNLAEKYGHEVLRLPPYHCIFNPIENIWGIAKNYYRDHVGSDGSSREKSLAVWREALQKITPQMWANTVRHTEEEIQRWWDREVGFDKGDIAPVIINLGQEDSGSDFEFSD